jgi:hypothetical protein
MMSGVYGNIDQAQIILTVRKSVRSIIDLDPKHQSQGMSSRYLCHP